MIRPSILARAEKCGYVPVLAEKYPEEGDAAGKGKLIHTGIATHALDDRYPEIAAAWKWIEANVTGRMHFEQHATLIDPISMEIITEGTPDLVAGPTAHGVMLVVDWKTGRKENVEDATTNLQLIAYGLATCEGLPFQCVLVFLDGDTADPQWSDVFEPDEHALLLERAKRAANKEPIPHPGDHCGSCYQRRYCHAWQAREQQALVPLGQGHKEVTADNANQLAEMIALVDGDNGWLAQAKAAMKAFVLGGGEVMRNGKRATYGLVAGRESADMEALRRDGLTKYIKRGGKYEKLTWRKP